MISIITSRILGVNCCDDCAGTRSGLVETMGALPEHRTGFRISIISNKLCYESQTGSSVTHHLHMTYVCRQVARTTDICGISAHTQVARSQVTVEPQWMLSHAAYDVDSQPMGMRRRHGEVSCEAGKHERRQERVVVGVRNW